MDRWQTKESFIKWIIQEENKAKTFSYYLSANYHRYPKSYYKSLIDEAFISSLNSRVNLIGIKSILTDEILAHLNAFLYDKDIEIIHISHLFDVIEEVTFFKKSGFSPDSQEFNREVKQLKKEADKLQLFSKEQIKIRIPKLPFIVIYSMKKRFKRYGLSKNEIDIFTSYFGNRFRETKSFNLECKRRKKIFDKNFQLKNKALENESTRRENKYNGFSYRTKKEYTQLINDMRKIDKIFYKKIHEEGNYYKPTIK